MSDLSGVSQPTVSRIIRKVSTILSSLCQQHITFPTTQEDKLQTMQGFYEIANFPGVLGAIDCTHVAIQSPGGEYAELYRNRKGYFSINVQAVCNARLEFTNIVARWSGSSHDATIFGNSRICAQFESGEITGILLGDGGYGCKKYLLTPLPTTNTPSERRYNFAQIRTRNPIERAFGVLKRRFPCLRMGLRCQKATSLRIIVACAVLHNIARKQGEGEPPEIDMAGRRVYEEVPVPQHAARLQAGATAMRNAFINNHF